MSKLINVASFKYRPDTSSPWQELTLTGDVSALSDIVSDISDLQTALTNEIITVSSAIAIPASGSSVTKNVSGLTADHVLIRWNFSTSAENSPPCNLSWTTASGSFTISNTWGTTSESITPVFALPTAKTAT